MAKVTGPLHSIEASGTIAKAITFDKRGIAHKPNRPGANRAASQGNTRQIFLAVSRALQRCQPSVKAAIQQHTNVSRNWRADMAERMIGTTRKQWSATLTAWNALE